MFDDISPTLKNIDGISLQISCGDVGGSALPTGILSQATEPKVSALRASIPAAKSKAVLSRLAARIVCFVSRCSTPIRITPEFFRP